jgi:ferredoxin-NADP reductase
MKNAVMDVELKLVRSVSLTTAITVFSFEVSPETFSFKGGQYMSLAIPADEQTIFRPFSIASVEGLHTTIDFVIPNRPDGLFSKYVHSLKLGDKIAGRGPMGQMTLEDFNYDIFYFLSTGTGLVPFRSMLLDIKKILNGGKDVFFYTQQPQVGLTPFYDDFAHLAITHSNFFFKVFCPDQITSPYITTINDSILNYLKQLQFRSSDSVFVSGNPEFISSLTKYLTAAYNKPGKIHTD